MLTAAWLTATAATALHFAEALLQLLIRTYSI